MATQRAAGRGSSRRYTGVEKAQAVRLVRALRAELGTGRGTVRRVADQLGFGVESAHKLWQAARRAGLAVGRDQVARLMRGAGIEGVRRRRRVRTTRPAEGAQRPEDLVERDFSAPAPNRLWVADLAYVATWAGVAYVRFVVDAFSRMIVGWRVAAHMRTQMVLDALEMARGSRGAHLGGLVAHTDAGSQGDSSAALAQAFELHRWTVPGKPDVVLGCQLNLRSDADEECVERD